MDRTGSPRVAQSRPALTIVTSEDERQSPRSTASRSSSPSARLLRTSTSSPVGSTLRRSCSTQRCMSPLSSGSAAVASAASPLRSAAASPNAVRSPASRSDSSSNVFAIDDAGGDSPTRTSSSKPMSRETYFRLLKKSQVLDQLLAMNAHVVSSEQQLRRLQTEKARTDSVQTRVFYELERYQQQFVDVQRLFLEVIEAMTLLCLKEEQLALGSSASVAATHATLVVEERTLQDLQTATVTISTKSQQRPSKVSVNPSSPRPLSSVSMSSPPPSPTKAAAAPASSAESLALAVVGRARVKQLEQICAAYDRQLVSCDAELTRATRSTFTQECLDKIAACEARERADALERAAMQERLAFLERQNGELQQQLAASNDANECLATDKRRVETQLVDEERAIDQFASDLKSELKKRYGVVPSVLELRWRHYFPHLAPPST